MINMFGTALSLLALFVLTNDAAVSPKTANFDEDFLAAHNNFRTLHGLDPLIYSVNLNLDAQKLASFLADVDNLRTTKGPHQENLYAVWSPKGGFRVKAVDPVNSWYSEIKDYNFTTGKPITFGAEIDRFAQVVWNTTTQLGVGVARSVSNWIYVVGSYWPRGNVPGQYVANVPRIVARAPEPVDNNRIKSEL